MQEYGSRRAGRQYKMRCQSKGRYSYVPPKSVMRGVSSSQSVVIPVGLSIQRWNPTWRRPFGPSSRRPPRPRALGQGVSELFSAPAPRPKRTCSAHPESQPIRSFGGEKESQAFIICSGQSSGKLSWTTK